MKAYKLFLSVLLSLILVFSSVASAQKKDDSTFTPAQVKSIEKIVHDYLVKNPQVLVEASRVLQQKATKEQLAVVLKAIKKYKNQLFNNPKSPTVGNPKGSVVLVEFFDYQCGHCKAMNQTIQELIKKNKDLKVIFKELPIFGDNSRYAAQVALAVYQQNKENYFKLHDKLLATNNPLTPEKIKEAVESLNINPDVLKINQSNSKLTQEVDNEIKENFRLAQELKVIGTPTFILSNKDHTKLRYIPGATSLQNMQQQLNDVKK